MWIPQLSPTVKAHDYSEAATELNGFDGWRRIVHQTHQWANTRRGTLRRIVEKMPQITRLEDIDAGILRFEAIMRDYAKAGGVVPTGPGLKDD